MRTGTLSEAAVSLARDLVQERRGFRPLSIDAGVFHEAGATTVQETAFLLASMAEHLVLLVDKGAHISDAITGMHVSLHISSSYFREIARIRALRMLLPLVEQGFTSEQSADPMPIHAVTSRRNMAALDPHMNLLRTTTEAASAAIGGADVIAVRPFDSATRFADDFSYRLARNVQLVLRHEAHLDKVGDPAAGSYYLEILTDVIARRAWQLFKEVEGRGGLLRMMETGELQRMIAERQSMRWNDLATGRRVLVGVNRYLDPVETMPEDPPYSPLRRTDSAEPVDPIFERLSEAAANGRFIADLDVGADRRKIGPPLASVREAEAIEELRLADPEADPGELASRLQQRITTS
jgi:methylmalonyl-CoA mutase